MSFGPIIEPYLYELTRDVKNPHPDLRKTDWQFAPTWTLGLRLVVCRAFDVEGVLEITRLYGFTTRGLLVHTDGTAMRHRPRDADQLRALLPALAPVSIDRPSLVLEYADRVLQQSAGAETVLDTLFRTGKISLDDVRAAIEERNRTDSP